MCLLHVRRCGTYICIQGPTFSSPAISSPAFSVPHFPVLHFPVPHFPVLHFGPSNLTSLVPHFPVLHFPVPHCPRPRPCVTVTCSEHLNVVHGLKDLRLHCDISTSQPSWQAERIYTSFQFVLNFQSNSEIMFLLLLFWLKMIKFFFGRDKKSATFCA